MPGPLHHEFGEYDLNFRFEEAHIFINTLVNIAMYEHLPGASGWLETTFKKLNDQEKGNLHLITVGFYHLISPERSFPSLESYISFLEEAEPFSLRDNLLNDYAKFYPISKDIKKTNCKYDIKQPEENIKSDKILSSRDNYFKFLSEHFSPDRIDECVEKTAYTYLINPPEMQRMIVSNLRHFNEQYFKPEWENRKHIVELSLKSLKSFDFSGKDRISAVEQITGRSLPSDWWRNMVNNANKIILTPSPFIGPHINYMLDYTEQYTMWIFFGPRQTDEFSNQIPELSRMELLLRLTALADDIRLQILRIIAQKGELKSGAIIEELDLSQSAASRHLLQLSASGFLNTRRCEGANCYTLNREKLDSTLRGIRGFLLT